MCFREAGDLNATPGSPEIQKLSKSWEMLNDPYQPTIPSDNPRNCIDYIFFKNKRNSLLFYNKSLVPQIANFRKIGVFGLTLFNSNFTR